MTFLLFAAVVWRECSKSVRITNGEASVLLTAACTGSQITGASWCDTRSAVCGGGAIDFAKHLLRLDFVRALKGLTSGRTSPTDI